MSLPPNSIAVVGMAGRFPGADSVSAFWRNLRSGTESIVTLSEDELIASGVSEQVLADRGYVRRAALMDGIDEFDAEFFGFTPQAARMMDPQHRLFLQSSWHALEDAGYRPGEIDGAVGVFGTSSASGYLLYNLMSHTSPDTVIGQGATFEMVSLSLQNDKDHLATRVAHQLNLHGPALSVQTACSSSLVAVHLACQSVLNGECDLALAGGASIRVPHRVGYFYEPGSMVSASGHCRPFDVNSDGAVFGSGVAVVVLKPLQDAVDDGDRIHAVIRGSAINNDGSTKMTYAAPNSIGQAEAIAQAQALAGVDASAVSYIETHGTGTPLGDPIELDGLRQAFAMSTADRTGPCYLGSVKSNIGHLETASGIAGLVKTILCLKHRAIPATLHFTEPNPELQLDHGPFLVRNTYGPWEWDGIRRAGVSSFGVGGTNAHVILEEAPPQSVSPAPSDGGGPQVLLLSARSAKALQRFRSALAAELDDGETGTDLADVAATLAGRRTENIRMAAVVHDRDDAAAVLSADDHANVFVGGPPTDFADGNRADTESGTGRVVFVFPGQGAQHVGMARGLYETEPVFAEQFDRCAAAFGVEMNLDLRSAVFDGEPGSLERTDHAQPALFAVEYALAKLVGSYGVGPALLAGHSIGEYVAATLAGVFDLDTAVKAVSMRARLMHAAPRGVMVAVPASPDAVAEHLDGDVDVATINDPGSCVVAGTADAVRAFQRRLAGAGITARRVRTSHAFHSRLMDPVIGEFTGFLSRLSFAEPRLPLLSNVTGAPLSAREATDPRMWARQIRHTVRFSDELNVLLAEPDRVLVEVGPGGALAASAKRHPSWSDGHRVVRLMRHHAQKRNDRDVFLLGLGQLWSAGIDVDWAPLRNGHRPRHVTVPGYPFERQRHWVEHRRGTAGIEPPGATAPAAAPRARSNNNGVSQMEETLQRIWAQCLGVDSVEKTVDFVELGGDSLVAISVAMTAAHEGLDLSPQDLYDNRTVTALAKTLTARYAAGGLARKSLDDITDPPLPPNVRYFLERGLAQPARWRIPAILQLRSDIAPDDIRAVLTAITDSHDALRLRIERNVRGWVQHIDEPGEPVELATRSLPGDVAPGSAREREAVRKILDEETAALDLSSRPLAAAYVRGSEGGPSYLAISLHGLVGDTVSREILFTDLFTAIGQRLAGEDVALQPVSTSWAQWSQRCAELAAHPAVLRTCDYWLETAGKADLRLATADVAEPPGTDDLVRRPSVLTAADTAELDDARRRLGIGIDQIVLAALARTIATTIGDGVAAVEMGGAGRSALKPDVDLRRTLGWFTTIHPVALACSGGKAGQLLDEVRDTCKCVPHYGIGYGLLRYLYAPTAPLFAAARPADIFFSSLGTVPDVSALASPDAPVGFDADTALAARDTLPGLGHPIELRAYRVGGAQHLDWWYDSRRVDAATAGSLADTLTAAVLTMIREALPDDETASAGDDLELVDLSSGDGGGG